MPKLKFPYLSVLLTGKHAEIVLNRGVGLHTVMGMSIDSGIGECIDKAFKQFLKFEKVLKDKDAREEFIERYNKQAYLKGGRQIPEGYFNFLDDYDQMSRGRFIELLG